jgi:Lipid A 3-O-deacylase (PagL)
VLCTAQDQKKKYRIGFGYGYGSEIKNTCYTYTNNYYKLQFLYEWKKGRKFEYEFLIQPEINFATHQLFNVFFVKASEPNFQEKRDEFSKFKNIKEYVLNVGFIVRRPITEKWSLYALGSIGPLITDTETERLSKGFAFSDVLALGLTFRTSKFSLDVRPNIRHVSNANLQSRNAGINTQNIEFAVVVPL